MPVSEGPVHKDYIYDYYKFKTTSEIKENRK